MSLTLFAWTVLRTHWRLIRMSKVFPSILPTGEEFVDSEYQERELQRLDYDALRSIAAEHPSDSVHGRMGKDELRDNLEGLERV